MIRLILAYPRFAVAWTRWALRGPYRLGDPLLGTGWMRDQNRNILRARWNAVEPKLDDFRVASTTTEEQTP